MLGNTDDLEHGVNEEVDEPQDLVDNLVDEGIAGHVAGHGADHLCHLADLVDNGAQASAETARAAKAAPCSELHLRALRRAGGNNTAEHSHGLHALRALAIAPAEDLHVAVRSHPHAMAGSVEVQVLVQQHADPLTHLRLFPAESGIPTALRQLLDLLPDVDARVDEVGEGVDRVHREITELGWPEAAQENCGLPKITTAHIDV